MTTKGKRGSSKPNDFRLIEKYHAASMDAFEKQSFLDTIKNKGIGYYKIGELSHAHHFYKYMSLDFALDCIENNKICFVEPSRWQDKYERRFYEADYSKQTSNKEDCPLLYSTCVTMTRFNEAAWKLYTYGKTGLGATCVEFQINKFRFRRQLVNAASEGDKIYEGEVMYCSQSMIDNIHKREIEEKGSNVPNKYYDKYVKRNEGVSYLNNYMNLLLMKRDAFKHENETRFFIQKNGKENSEKARMIIENDKVFWGETLELDINWIDVIEKVYINAEENSREYKLLSEALKKKLNEKYTDDNEPEKERIWESTLKPSPYFVYGQQLNERLVIE